MPIERVKSPLQSNLPISNAIRAGKNIFTSQVPRVPSTGEILSDGDIGKQARQTFENLKVVMESAGGSLANVVQLTIFLVEAEDAAEMNLALDEDLWRQEQKLCNPALMPNAGDAVGRVLAHLSKQ